MAGEGESGLGFEEILVEMKSVVVLSLRNGGGGWCFWVWGG